MNMLQHGQAVHDEYIRLWQELKGPKEKCSEPLLRQWFEKMRAHQPCLNPHTLRSYHLYHDCGKHLVFHTDEAGRKHFPHHAEASALQYQAIFPQDANTRWLIAHDMDFHTLRGEAIRCLWSNPLAPALYLTAWAEIRANAAMFGGVDSESFKIKRSRLLQAAKKCSFNFNH